MRIVIITQNEPFYLYDNLKYLIEILPNHSKIVGCVVSEASPFGKKDSFLKKTSKTFRVFGVKFFIYYALKYIISKLNPVKNIFRMLKKNNIDIINLDEHINSFNSVKRIKSYSPDLLISILGNQIFKSPIINLAPKGCINLHTAMLPKYRGLMPTFWVLKNNEIKTGVSVFFVDEGIDSGPIVSQRELVIGNRTQKELIIITKKIGMELIAESVDKIYYGNYKLIENDASKMTYYSFPTSDDVNEFVENGKLFF